VKDFKLIKIKSQNLISLLVLLEICCHHIFQEWLNIKVLSIIYFLLGIAICAIGTAQIRSTSKQITVSEHQENRISNWWIFGIALVLFMIMEDACKVHFSFSPLDYRSADMLPVIKVMGERFINGDTVYAIIPEIWGGMKPIYLPAMWLPYTIPIIGDIDIRWISVISTWLALVLALLIALRNKVSTFLIISLIALMAILIGGLLHLDFTFFTLTEEGVVLGYYALLCFAIVERKPFLLGLGLALCLLSRFALVPWAICFMAYVFLTQSKFQIQKSIATTLIVSLVLLVISGAYLELGTFLSLSSNYLDSIIANPSKYEPLIQSSLGLTKFVPYSQLGLLHIFFQLIAFLIPLSFFGWMYLRKAHESYLPLIGLLGLKIALVGFYNFLIMPYPYLFYTSTIVSLYIIIMVYITTRSPLSLYNTRKSE